MAGGDSDAGKNHLGDYRAGAMASDPPRPPVPGTEETVDAHGATVAPAPVEPGARADASTLSGEPIVPGAELLGPLGPLPTMDPALLPEVAPEHYVVTGERGRGGMGRVLSAVDRRLRRPVALKELLSRRPDSAARFVREALVTARLEHPSIVPVHEAGRWPSGEPFYAMKLIDGRPLDAIIRERATLPERLALLPTVIAVCEAVAYAHSRRVIHRDLKPANVVVGAFGETMVIDWGLSKQLDTDEPEAPFAPSPSEMPQIGASEETAAGAILGTPGYMPPEQAMGHAVDERADVYALGTILYTMLAGEPPYTGRDATEILAAVILGAPPPLDERQPGVPRELSAIVAKAMARVAGDRYADARELVADLKRFQTGQLVGAHQYSTAALLLRFVRRHRVVLSVLGSALVVVVAIGAVSVRRVVRERDRADHERAVAVAERAQAEAARAREALRVDELILAHARATIDHDATTALAWLKKLRPESKRWPYARELAGEAVASGVAYEQLDANVGPLSGFAFAPDGKMIAGGSHAARVVGETELYQGELHDLALSADGRLVLTADGDGSVHVCNRATGERTSWFGHSGAVTSVALDGAAALAASGGRDGSVRLWDVRESRPRATIAGRAPIAGVALSPDGALVAAQDAAALRLYSTANGRARPLAQGERLGGGGAVRFSPDGKRLAAGGRAEVALWELASGEVRHFAVESPVERVAFSPDGARLAAACEDGSVELWELRTSRKTEIAHHGGDGARDVTFSPDGNGSPPRAAPSCGSTSSRRATCASSAVTRS
jgi:WD40 repeat protein